MTAEKSSKIQEIKDTIFGTIGIQGEVKALGVLSNSTVVVKHWQSSDLQ